MYLDNDRRPTLTPQLAVRVAIIGGIALFAFAIVFFRLWFLQVLSADTYKAEAQGNQLREIRVQAPRGDIVDRNGRPLVTNRVGLAVKITPDKLPENRAKRHGLYRRLGRLLEMRPRVIGRRVDEQFKELPFSTATVKQDVSRDIMMYIDEREEDFPGVEIDPVFLRQYPYKQLGAHLFGYVGEVSAGELKQPGYSRVQMGDRVGKAGVELEYDQFLRGESGATKVQVDSLGNFRRKLGETRSQQGRQLRLSIDLDVQRAGQEALAGGTGKGAFAVMNIHNGEVLGLGSNPSYDPNLFAKVVKESDYKRLTSDETGSPLTDRAVAGGYPTGSTFKLITATAALESGTITPDTPLNDPGEIKIGDVTFKNAGGVAHGVLSLRQALTVSSDVFFYQLGRDMNEQGMPLQKWARKLGLGRLDRHRPARRVARLHPDAALARRRVQEVRALQGPQEAHPGPDLPGHLRLRRPALVGRRQRQPGRRAGRRPGQPAPDGGRVRAACHRQGGAAAAGPADRELGRSGGAAARGAEAALAGHPRRVPLRDPGRVARGRERAGRHLDPRLRELPDPDRGQDGNG